MAWITQRVEYLMGAYRRDDFNNPAHWAINVTELLEQFPDIVIESATSPKSGLQTQAAFPPNPAEIRAFCERSLRSYNTIALNNARKERAAALARHPPPPVSSEPKVDLAARHPEWLSPEARAARRRGVSLAPAWEPRSLEALAAEAGNVLTQAQIDAMPNNPTDWKKLKTS